MGHGNMGGREDERMGLLGPSSKMLELSELPGIKTRY